MATVMESVMVLVMGSVMMLDMELVKVSCH